MSKESGSPRWTMFLLPVLLVCSGVTSAAQANRLKGQGETLAANERYRVVFFYGLGGTLGLEVFERPRKLIWSTQPSSTVIHIALAHNRIVIFTKTENPGRMDEGKPFPCRGAKMFTLAGEEVGVLPPSVYDGAFVGALFLAKKVGGGVIAYDLDAAKELWHNDKVKADEISLAGPGLVNIRWYDSRKKVIENHLLSLQSGKVVYQISSSRNEDVKVLTASDERCLTLRTVTVEGAVYWKSELLDKAGQKMAEIRWQGGPIKAAFSADGRKLAAICVSPAKEKGRKGLQYILEVYTRDGKRLQRKKLLTADADVYLEPSVVFDSHSVRASLTRKLNVYLKEAK